jgi:hypothetical protein
VCCTLVEATRIVVTTAMLPGTHQFQYSYVLPLRGNETTLDLTSGETVQHLSVFLPEEMSTVSVVGLNAGQIMDSGQQRIRSFNAGAVSARQPVKLVIGPAKAASATPAESATVVEATTGSSMKTVVGLATVGLVVAGLVALFRPGPSRSNAVR